MLRPPIDCRRARFLFTACKDTQFVRHHASAALSSPQPNTLGQPQTSSTLGPQGSWPVIRKLLPYLLKYKLRMGLALAALISAKVANIGIPVLLKEIVDGLTPGSAVIGVSVGLVLGYGLIRLASTGLTELRELIFARVTQGAARDISRQVFEHLHKLSLRFHLERQTGGLTRDIERGTRGVGTLVNFTLYSIVPTAVEVLLVTAWLAWFYPPAFALITLGALVAYVGFTFLITEWRTHFRREMNELDSRANARAIDSLLNYETVKYFNNESFEAQRYDRSLARWQDAAIKSQASLSVLNIGQAAIIATAASLMLWQAVVGVEEGRMTIGDLVLVNAFLIQLYIPLNFLGVLYREIKQSIADMERLFGLLAQNQEVADPPGAPALHITKGGIHFEKVCFAYDPRRPILKDLELTIEPGQTVAVVGSSGAGKSTLARLLYRFYDTQAGRICIDGQDIRLVQQDSLRRVIGIVPQDTVLFNDSLAYNIRYGKPDASDQELEQAIAASRLESLVQRLPDGLNTPVGERGLKLSGGEKQRVAIARAMLKKPAILIFDEATSALDSESERAIQHEIEEVSKGRTSIIIAHRLSTIRHASTIMVLEDGRLVEKGSHTELLDLKGRYSQLWELQAREASQAKGEAAAPDSSRPAS
jgi:ABC-type transport system involved in Fe-S cluster assembly fused permease/ATPase subunit